MITFAVANQKGGTGKTTTSVALAHKLALDGYRVLVVDIDSQGHVATTLGLSKAPGIDRLVQWYKNRHRDISTPFFVVKARPNLDIIPSDDTTSEAKETLTGLTLREQIFEKMLEQLDYDVVVIDCAPSRDILHIAALVAANWLIIPAELNHLALDGVNEVIHLQTRIRTDFPNAAALLGILPTFFDRRKSETSVQLNALVDTFKELVLPPIPIDAKIEQAPAFGQTIWEYDPNARSIKGVEGRTGHYGGYERFVEQIKEKLM